MNDAASTMELIRRRKTGALSALLGLSLLFGIAQAANMLSKSQDLMLLVALFQLAPLFAGFVWLHYDSIEHSYVRTFALNAGIVLLAIVFVPVYFYRTRPEGARAPAITGFFSLVLACMGLSIIGAYAMLALSPDPSLTGT